MSDEADKAFERHVRSNPCWTPREGFIAGWNARGEFDKAERDALRGIAVAAEAWVDGTVSQKTETDKNLSLAVMKLKTIRLEAALNPKEKHG